MSAPVVAKTADTIVTGITNVGEADSAMVMAVNRIYEFTADQDCWIAQGTAPVAAAKANGSRFVAKGVCKLISGNHGPTLSILGTAAGGFACLVECQPA